MDKIEKPISPFMKGWRMVCPRCAKGALYQSYLKPALSCKACGLDYSRADAGDGAVPFVMMISGFCGIVIGLLTMFYWNLEMIWTILIACLLATMITLFLLPRVKAILIAMQYRYKAGDDSSLRFKNSD